MRLFNKGFSLVEIIVGLAIMSIVAGTVGAFIVTSNNSYMRGSNEITMQEEAQLTANQMIDLIIDVTNGVTLYEGTGSAIDIDGNKVADGVPVKELRLFNEEEIYMLRWQGAGASEYGSENQVYLSVAENTTNAEGELVLGDPDFMQGNLLAQYVTSFSPDLTFLKDRKVVLKMEFNYQDRIYNIDETIKLRNAIPYEVTPEHMYKDRPVVYDWITGITISPNPAETTPGGTVAFSYTLTGDPGAVAQGVTWSLKGENGRVLQAGTTIDSNGILYVDAAELLNADPADPAMSVTVTSVADPGKSATAMVLLNPPTSGGVTSLVIKPKEATVMQGSSFDFGYTMTGSQAAIDMGVTWKVEVNSAQNAGYVMHSGTTINSEGDLRVDEDQMLGGAILLVTVTAKADPSMKDTAVVSVVKASLEGAYDNRIIARNLETYVDPTTGLIGYKGNLECLTATADYRNGYPKITWQVLGDNPERYQLITSGDPHKEGVPDGPQYYAALYCGTQMDTTVRVQATVQLNSDMEVVLGIDIMIPKLETTQDKKKPYIAADNFVLERQGAIHCTIENYFDADGKKKEVYWKLEDYPELSLSSNNPSDRLVGFREIATMQKLDWYQEMFPKNAENDYKNKEIDYTAEWWDDKGSPNGAIQNYAKIDKGSETTINAKYYINYDREYKLKLVALDVDKGTQVAETLVTIPRFDILFTNDVHYTHLTYNKWNGIRERYFVKTYGYAAGAWHTLSMDCQLMAEKEFTERVYVESDFGLKDGVYGATLGFNGVKDTETNITNKTPNEYYILKLWDKAKPDSPRYLTFYVDGITDQNGNYEWQAP